MRAVVEQSIRNQLFFANQQAGTLWSTNSFTSTKGNEVVPHIGVVPKMRNGRSVRGSVVESRNLALVRELYPLIDLDLARRVGKIGKVHHGRSWIDGPLHVLARLHFDKFHARSA